MQKTDSSNQVNMTAGPLFHPDRIPTLEECYELMAKYSMLPNIIVHSEQVMRVSLLITDNLKDGMFINKNLVTAASLLHDITKTRALKTREHHDQSGFELLRKLGFASTGEIVGQHVSISNFDPRGKLEEREIVNYADKRVMHDKIVSLEVRVQDLLERYGTTEERKNMIRKHASQALDVEKKIKGFMAVDLDSIIYAIRQERE